MFNYHKYLQVEPFFTSDCCNESINRQTKFRNDKIRLFQIKTFLITVIYFLFISFLGTNSFAGNFKCEEILDQENKGNSNIRQFFDLFIRGKYNIPKSSKVLRPKPTATDVNLLLKSYQNLDLQGKPVEFGTIQLLNKSRKIIADIPYIMGKNNYIHNLNEFTFDLIVKNFEKYDQINTIVIKHTHPFEIGYEPEGFLRFSQMDLDQDIEFIHDLISFDVANTSRRIKVESYIVAFNPSFLYGRSFSPVTLLSNYKTAIKNNVIVVVGYLPKK